jgi:hypothetical protein
MLSPAVARKMLAAIRILNGTAVAMAEVGLAHSRLASMIGANGRPFPRRHDSVAVEISARELPPRHLVRCFACD